MNSSAPRLALRVGVIGNRRFGSDVIEDNGQPFSEGDPEAIGNHVTNACKEALSLIASGMNAVLKEPDNSFTIHKGEQRSAFTDEAPLIRIVTGLAAGADQLAAAAAFEIEESKESNCDIQLDAILPFSEHSYINDQDFTPTEKALSETLLEKATQIFRVSAEEMTGKESRNTAFITQGKAVVYTSDIIIAIWDPKAKGGKSMTKDRARAALLKATPVIAIHPGENDYTIRLMKQPQDLEPGSESAQLSCSNFQHDLERELFRQLNFSHSKAEIQDENLSKEDQEKREKARREARDEAAKRYTLLLREDNKIPWSFDKPILGWVWKCFDRIFGGNKEKIVWAEEALWLEPLRKRAENIQGVYSAIYRGSFVIAYLLAAIASGLAVLALIAAPIPVVLILGGAKLLILFYLIWLSWRARNQKIQERATDFRFYVEMLRPMSWLAPVGLHTPACRLPAHYLVDDPRQSWMSWLLRARIRELPIVQPNENNERIGKAVSLDSNSVGNAIQGAREEWLREQVSYHSNNHDRMHKLHHNVERLALCLLGALIAAVLVHVIMEFSHFSHGEREVTPSLVGSILGFLAAFLPACLAALGGLAYQSEARRLSNRSEGFAMALRSHQDKLTIWEEAVRNPGSNILEKNGIEQSPDELLNWQALRHIRSVSQVMIDEVGDWKILYQANDVHAG